MTDTSRSTPIRYGGAAFVVLLATAARLALDPLMGDQFPFATLFFAVLIAAGYGGRGPALLATGLGAVLSARFLLPPRDGLAIRGGENQAGMALYLAVGLGISGLGGTLRDARRRAERDADEAARQREQLRITLASIGDAVIVTDDGGRVTSLNQVAEALTGWTSKEADRQPLPAIFRIVDERTRSEVESPALRALREGVVVGLANHTVLIARDGTERPIDDSAAPIRDREGRVVGAVLVFRDVAERRRAERALEASERELADFFENATVGFHWVGPDGTILRANRAELEMLGYERDEYVGRHIAEFHADQRVIGSILRCLSAGEDLHDYPARLRCKDGSIRDVRIDSSVLWEGGRFVHTRCFTRDVTERERAVEALRDQTRIAEALNRIGVLVAAELDLDRLVQFVTDEATRLTDARFGAFFYNVTDERGGSYTLYTISGVPREAFSAFPMPRATGLFGPTFRGEGIVRLDDVTADPRFGRNPPYHGMPGGHLPVRSYLAVPVASRTGEVLGGLFFGHPEPGVFTESDERLVAGIAAQAAVAIDNARLYREVRAAKDEAEAANQAKTQFLAVLSHELRTPLNPILLATSALLERPADPGELLPTLAMVRQNVLLQARLIDDLLDVMRIVRGKMPLHWEVADCHKLIDQAVQVCRSEVLGHRLHLEAALVADRRHVNADPARLQQVFWNLVKNAVKFTPEGGAVTIRTRNQAGPDGDGERIVVEVSDTGIGIEPEVLPVIFDPFQQGETTITRKFGGLGLGLAICKGIVDAHGGTLEAESEGKGRGTTFRVTLKALPEPDADGAGGPDRGTPEAAGTGQSVLRILAVEDEPATLRLMARLLRGLGHEVSTAGSVGEAIREYQAGAFDLIVSDIGLPDGTGLDLMRRAVALRGPVAAIALTGYGMEEDIRRSREAGFTAHLTKPIDFAKLEAMIRQVAPRGS